MVMQSLKVTAVALAFVILAMENVVVSLPSPMWHWSTPHESNDDWQLHGGQIWTDALNHQAPTTAPQYGVQAPHESAPWHPLDSQQLEHNVLERATYAHASETHEEPWTHFTHTSEADGTLDDIVAGSVRHHFNSEQGAYLDTSHDQPLNLASRLVSSMEPDREPAFIWAIREKFPGNVHGIIKTPPPGFLKRRGRGNKYKNADTPEIQHFLNNVYFDNRLHWLPTTPIERDFIRLTHGKSRVQYVLPSISEGDPPLRLHRHTTGSRASTAYHDRHLLIPNSIFISVWSDPVLQPQTAVKNRRERDTYITEFYGFAQLRMADIVPVVDRLESVIRSRPRANYLRFTDI